MCVLNTHLNMYLALRLWYFWRIYSRELTHLQMYFGEEGHLSTLQTPNTCDKCNERQDPLNLSPSCIDYIYQEEFIIDYI